MEFYQVIKERRSVRRYLEDDIPQDMLERILEAARWAPSWANYQCWRFIIVKDQAKKEKLAEALPEKNPAGKGFVQAPAVVVLCGDPSASGSKDGKDYYLLDAGLAMEHLVLAAKAEGLGTCWVAWMEEEVVRETCKVPEQYRVVAMTPLGYPAKEPKAPPRKDFEEVFFFDEWGESWN